MNRTLWLTLVVAGSGAFAQDASFDTADKYLRESSFSRACDGFTTFLKATPASPLAREATAKRAMACLKIGKGSYYSELKEVADKGEKDFARAYAAWALAERGDRTFAAALPLLKQAAGGNDRPAIQARELFVRGALLEMERNSYDRAKLNSLCEDIQSVSTSANDKAHARLMRARSYLQGDQKSAAAGEAELNLLGEGNSGFADDALYELGSRRENEQKFPAALEIYGAISKRFSPSTSNVRESAESRAAEIRRPWITLSIGWIELPGMKPQVSASFRNVANAKWSVRKIEPSEQSKELAQSGEDALLQAAGTIVSTWESKLSTPGPHAQGASSFELDVKEPGAYVLEVKADGKHVHRAFALVTQHVTVVKVGKDSAVTFTVDAETGKAVAGAEATLFVHDYDGRVAHDRLTAQADETGVARFDLRKYKRPQVTVWVKSGAHWSWARANSGYYHSNDEQALGWVLTDRPLYKPGETVNFKIFLRTRNDGPSVPVKGEKFTFHVRDASGKELGKPELTTNAFGTATYAVKLGKQAQLGTYSFYLSNNQRSYQLGISGFRVEEYKPPEYTVAVTPVGNPKPNGSAKFKVAASFFFGGPVASAAGRAIVSVRSWTHQWKPWPEDLAQANSGTYPGRGEGDGYGSRYPYVQQLAQLTLKFKTGADGTAEVEVPPTSGAEHHPGITWDIQVFVTDASRREVQGRGAVNASAQPYFVDVRTDRFLYKPGEKVQLKFRAEDANGRPESPELVAQLVKITQTGVGASIAQKKVKLDRGTGTASLDADALGPVRVEVRAAGAASDAPVLASADLWLTNDAKPMIPPNAGFALVGVSGRIRESLPVDVRGA